MPNPRRITRPEDFELEVEVEAANARLTELVSKTMDEQGVSRAELARRLGVSPPQVTQFLRGERNITLRTVVEALFKMSNRLDIVVVPLEGGPVFIESKTHNAAHCSADDAQVAQYTALHKGHDQGVSRRSTKTSVPRRPANPGAREMRPQYMDRWLKNAMRDEIADAQHPAVQYWSDVSEAPTDEDRSIQSWVDGKRDLVTDREMEPVLVG